MKKRIWSKAVSIFTAILLVVGIVPNTTITALAAEGAPGSLYVAGQQITDEGYYTQSGGNWTKSGDASTPPSAPYFHYTKGNDNTPATLTLSGATIQGGTSTGTVPYGAGIYAQCSNGQSVTLTIKLIGENTITGYYGIYVNAEISADSNGTDASLTITGENKSSLEVSGSSHGIFVKSGTGNASLNIEKATVTSSTNGGYAAGVNVQSSANATGSPNISLSVNGGSLTASGTGSSDGIQFYVGSLQATGVTTSLTITDNAIVDARNGGISALRISETLPTPTPTGDNRSGIVFDGSTGTVYGDVTLDESLTINQGETLTIPEGSTLNSNGNLTNNGTILASGGTLEGKLSNGTTPTTPNITEQPYDYTVTEGEDATFTVEASAGSETLTYQWQQSTDNGSSWTNIESETNASYTINSTNTSMNGYQYRCVVTGSGGVSVISQTATLTVQAKPASVPVTGVKLNKDSLTLQEKDSDTLTATVEPADATNQDVIWKSSDTSIATVSEDGTVTAISAGNATITATAADGSGISASCTLTVTHGNMVQTPKKDATCTVDGTEEYWTCEICGKHFEDESGTIPTTPEENKIQATGHSYGEPVWSWAEDGKTCKVTFTCEKDENHKKTPEVKVTSAVKTPATCTEKGVTTYTATVEFNGKTYTDTKDLTDIPATGHSYGEPVWNWSEDGKTCTVTFICEKDETHKETPKVKITSAVKTPATCTEAGVTTYTATVEFNDKTHTDTKDVADIPAIGHKLTKTEAKAPTSTDTGNIEYWYCKVCDKYFSDEKAEHEITLEDTIIAKLPKLISGANQEWTKGSKDGLTFKVDTDINEFKKVLVDGKELKDTNYDIKSGSTILTLKSSFLDTLSAGKHQICLEFNNGTIEAYFTVKVKETTTVPETGEQTNLYLWAMLAIASSASILVLRRYKKYNR